jgi:hypothetical protein
MEETGPYFLCTGEIDDGVTMAGGTRRDIGAVETRLTTTT